MISKINELKRLSNIPEVKSLCETTIAAMSSAIYNGVTPEARFEIERVAVENLFEGLSKYPKNKIIKEWLDNEKRVYSIKNIGVRKTINALKESEGKYDQTLYQILEHFEEKVDQKPEVLIYEEFISALDNNYSWIPGVKTQLSSLRDKVGQYKNDIDITKIIETMKVTKSNYLLPLIEDVVNDYIANKTEQTKSHLKETLVKFSYDPFVRDLINIVMLDSTDLQLEYASGHADIEKIYSPLLYLGENEVVFNIKNSFYVKKGNNVNKLKKNDIEKLDENYKALCEAINVPNVEFHKDKIDVYVGNDKATITENQVEVNARVMNEQEFKDAAEVSQWAGTTNFFMLTNILKENFNEIVEVDFAKRVYLKEDESHAADVIKLRNNLYITTYDPINNKSTFYRNINPIQAEKIMMEHMRFDVSETFSDILPNKEKILKQINESKQSYVDYIKELELKINEFESNPYNKEVNKEVVDVLKEELREVKNEYKDYVNEMEKYTDISEAVTVSIDVDGEKYTVPIPQKNSTAKGEESSDKGNGTVVGAEHMEDSPASEITFDDEESELLGDSPSIQDDEIDLGVDNVEAQADAAEAGAEGEEDNDETPEGDEEGGDDLGLGDEEGTEGEDDLGLGDKEESEDEEDEEDEEKNEEKKEENEDENKNISEEGDNDEDAEEIEAEIDAEESEEESEEAPEELEKGDLNSEEDVEVEDIEAKEKSSIKVFLKKKVSESLNEHHKKDKKSQVNFILKNKKDCKHTKEELMKMDASKIKKMYDNLEKEMGLTESKSIKKNSKHLKENAQITDTVKLDGEKGYVIGQANDGDLLVQIQGSVHKVKPNKVNKVKSLGNNDKEPTVKPPYEFDKKTLQNLTTKTLFEQFVKCGVYMGNTPVKLNDCFVKYSDWNNANDDKPLSVIVEGNTSILPKSQIRILEDVNDFANPDKYEPGVLIDEESGEAIEDVLINVEELMNAIGDSDSVTIIKNPTGEQILTTAPNSALRPAG